MVRAIARRPLAVLVAVGVLCLVAAGFAFRLEPSASTDTLISSSTDSFKATEGFKEEFGDDPVIVFVKGDLEKTILTADLGRLIRLEGCLSGNVPAEGLAQLPKVCSELAKLKPAKVVYGPGTFVNTAADQILTGFKARQGQSAAEGKAAADAARKAAAAQGLPRAQQERLAGQAEELANKKFVEDALKLALRYGLTSLPSVDNPEFVAQLVLDPSAKECSPKARFAYLFPSCKGALIQVRLRPNLTDAERVKAIGLIREATALDNPACRASQARQGGGAGGGAGAGAPGASGAPGAAGETGSGAGAQASSAKACDFKLEGGASYVISGVPVVVDGLASAVGDAIFLLLAAALLVMGATLAVVFRTRLRLLPLTLALGAASLTFGALSLAGGELTMASIAVLPVLIGLAVDYAIQFQARFDEQRSLPSKPVPAEAAADAARLGGPTIATAGIATAAGFLVLLLSPVPMVKGFGLLLVIGIVLALGCALTAGFAALVRFSDPRDRAEEVPPLAPRARAFFARSGDRVVESRPWVTMAALARRVWSWLSEQGERAFHGALDRPRRALAIGLLIAVCGWALDTQTEVISDVRELVPQDLQALKDVNELQTATGVSGEIDVVVRAKDVTDPKVVEWMASFQAKVLKDAGYKTGATCAQRKDPPELCPALSLPDLFSTGGGRETRESIRGLLNAVPPYFSQGVVSAPKDDGSREIANLAFGIRLGSLERQQEVIEDIESRLDPPPGVKATVAGLPVLAAQANDSLSSPGRRALTLLAGLVLSSLCCCRPTAAARRGGPVDPDRARDGLVGAVALLVADPVEPDVGHARRARDRDLDRVQRPALGALRAGARAGPRPARGDRADLRLDRLCGARLRGDRDRRLRGADRLGHPDAARFRRVDRHRPDGVAARRDGHPPCGADLGRATRALRFARPRPATAPARALAVYAKASGRCDGRRLRRRRGARVRSRRRAET